MIRVRPFLASLCIVGTLLSPVQADALIFGEFGLQEEMKMGRDFEVVVKSSMPIIEDPEIRDYVQGIVDKIVGTLPPQPYKFPTNVVLHDSLNAFAAPGGFVFVFSGLLMQMEHESQLAGVLSHEIAHVVQRHIAGRIERGRTVSLASLAAMIAGVAAGLGGGANAGGALITGSMAASSAAMLNYSRLDEDDADRFGLQYLVKAGYNPRGLGGAFEIMRSQDWSRGGSMPAYLSTHPDLNVRLARLRADLETMPKSILSRKEDDTRFFRIQALLWARHGDPVLAERYYEKKGKTAISLMGRGMLASRLNRIAEAEKYFAESLRLAPKDPLILREAGIFEYSKGDVKKARLHLQQALKLSPRDFYGLFYYARLLEDAGNREEAQKLFRQILKKVPQDSEVHAHYGRSLGASGKLSEGYLHLAYSAMYERNERRARNMLEKARAAARSPQEQKAIKDYEEEARKRAKIMKDAQ